MPAQRAVEERPRAQDFLEWQPRDHRAASVEANARADRNAERPVDGDAEPAHDVKQFDVRADADAATGEIAAAAFEHRNLPAGLAQQQPGKQAAERAADDQCANSSMALRWLPIRGCECGIGLCPSLLAPVEPIVFAVWR